QSERLPGGTEFSELRSEEGKRSSDGPVPPCLCLRWDPNGQYLSEWIDPGGDLARPGRARDLESGSNCLLLISVSNATLLRARRAGSLPRCSRCMI
ncbi:hypothetical protein NXF25_016495, partial [Crotalus adamanteus]